MTKLQQMEAILIERELNEAMKFIESQPALADPVVVETMEEPRDSNILTKRSEAFESLCKEYRELFKAS